ncbi:hypothetical protein BTUL_0145g00250 [Botrytis tulipae]|uniref:Uncharacterized protein n=1 Tax=Botrytis tulipae TaxID=87230 RepID=A0A4Z1EM88_9HELO|nr:hypothetical protein BTUL_0145g00250 [Botrytis tulipae]
MLQNHESFSTNSNFPDPSRFSVVSYLNSPNSVMTVDIFLKLFLSKMTQKDEEYFGYSDTGCLD